MRRRDRDLSRLRVGLLERRIAELNALLVQVPSGPSGIVQEAIARSSSLSSQRAVLSKELLAAREELRGREIDMRILERMRDRHRVQESLRYGREVQRFIDDFRGDRG